MDSPILLIGEETTSLDESIVSYINLQRALKYFQKISNKNNNDNNKTTAHIILFHGIPELSIRRRKKYPDINLLKKNPNSKHRQYTNFDTRIQKKNTDINKCSFTVSESPNGYVSNISVLPVTNAATVTTVINTNELTSKVRLVGNLKHLEDKI